MRRAFALIITVCFLLCLPALAEEVTVITDRAGLEAMAAAPSGHYRLEADIDLSGADWTPFAFSGTLEGNGHAVTGMRITAPGAETRETKDGNYKHYETYFAGLFSVLENAVIRDLEVKNAILDVETGENCFIAGIAGYAENSELTGCSVSGRFTLTLTDGVNIGAGGLAGYMDSCTAEDCVTDTELVIADLNTETVSEEFAGGLYASGRGKIKHCSVKTRIWASVHGYVHNGGCAGMAFWVHRKDDYKQHIYNTVSDTEIVFFEDSPSKRSYADPYIGENLGSNCRLSGNKKKHFKSEKVRSYDTLLLPEGPYEDR